MLSALIQSDEGVNAVWVFLKSLEQAIQTLSSKEDNDVADLRDSLSGANDYTDKAVNKLYTYVDAMNGGVGGLIDSTSYDPSGLPTDKPCTLIALGSGTFTNLKNSNNTAITVSQSNSITVFFRAAHITYWNYKTEVLTAPPMDATPTDGNTTHVVSSDGVYDFVMAHGIDDVDVADTTGSNYLKDRIIFTMRKNVGTVSEPEYETIADFTIPVATATKAGLMPAYVDGVFDVNRYVGSSTPYDSLSQVLTNAATLIPTAVRRGGMSIKFIQSSDNKYVQYRYTSSLTTVDDFTNVDNWQGVDDEPSTGSKNLVKSGGIEKFVNNSVKGVNKKVFGTLKNSVELYTNISYTILSFTIEGGRQYTIKANLSAVLSRSVLIDIKQNDNLIYIRPIVGGALTLTYTWTPSSSLSGEVDIVISTADPNAKGKIFSIVVENVEDSLDVELEQIDSRFNSLSNIFAPIQHTHTVSQITDIEENYAKYIEISSNKNLLKPTTKTGVINADGTISANGNYYVSDFILVSPNTLYILSHEIRAYVEFDINKNAIQSTYKTYTRLVRTDSKCRYIKISYSKSATQVQFEQNYKVTEYVPYVGKKVINSNSLSPDIDIANTIFSKDYAGGKNLLNRNYEISGILDSTGNISASTNIVTSDFIPVLYNTNITISGTAASDGFVKYYCFYDINKSIVSYASVSSSSNLTLSVPKNAVMFRCSYRRASTDVMIEVGNVASEYEGFIPVRKISNDFLPELKVPEGIEFLRNLWYGKKLTVDGDSITHDQGGHNYWQYILKNNLTMGLLQSGSFQCGDGTTEHVGNRGIGGSRIAYGEEQNDIKYCIGSRYQYLSDSADLVIIAGGTNDWAHNGVALGTMEDRTNVTFYGALHLLCNGLIVKYPSKQIVFMTPIKRGQLGFINQRGNTLEEFANAIIEVCGYYGIPVIDLFHQLCMNPSISQQQTLYFGAGDDTHPNTAGQLRMGNFVTGKVKEIQTVVDWE